MISPLALRTHEKMKEVLMHPEESGPDVHYYMIRGGSDKKNITVWEPGTIGGEYIKAYGHYHVGDLSETYNILEGQGIILLQRCEKDASGNMLIDRIKKFVAVMVKAGDSVFIPSGIGHLLLNIGSAWTATSDDSPVNFSDADPVGMPGHADYESVRKMRGFAYYVVEKDGAPSFVKNPSYVSVPKATIVEAKEYTPSLIKE
jgi:oxalate decarboxylase/phosphoglucose isomerase-like protein (cupin superfamily)